MFVEDLLGILATKVQINSYDSNIVSSFYNQIFLGRGLTEKQSALSLKILKRQKSKLDLILNQDISSFLENPTFRLKKRSVQTDKILKICDHSIFKKSIHASFPYNEELIQIIRKNRSHLNDAQWDPEEKSWIFPLDEKTLIFLKDNFLHYDFLIPEEIQNYFEQITEIQNTIEKYTPMLCFEENQLKFKNLPKNTPTIETSDILEALFFARKVGINVWDEQIENFLEHSVNNKAVKPFLNTTPDKQFELYLDQLDLFSLSPILKHLLPCIFVIPGGSEMQKTLDGLELLKTMNIDNSEISVMFRLPRETGDNFNKYIKDNGLNNPLTDKTKVIFISSKVSKPVIESKINFNSIVNFNFYNVHYTIRNFLKNHENVINIFDKTPQRNLNFGNM